MVGTPAFASCCCCCCHHHSPQAPLAFDSMAARLAPAAQRAVSAAISARLQPLISLGAATNSAGPAAIRRSLSEQQRLAPWWALSSNWGSGFRAYYTDGGYHEGRLNSTAAQVYGQYGEDVQQEEERSELPRPPVIQWEKDLANSVQLIGHVGRDISIKYLNSGKVVAETSLAVRKSANRNDDPSWFELEIWDALAEIAAHHVAKGEQILVAGRIVVDKRVTDTTTYSVAKVVVRDLCFVESYNSRQSYDQSGEEETATGSSSRGQEETPQQNRNQQRELDKPSHGTVSQKGSFSSSNEASLATEKRWQEYFADPTQWWDNREKKRNPKAPDFKHKSTQEALWITSWNNPPWVAQQLAVLEDKKAQHKADFRDSHGHSQDKKLSSFKESDFY